MAISTSTHPGRVCVVFTFWSPRIIPYSVEKFNPVVLPSDYAKWFKCPKQVRDLLARAPPGLRANGLPYPIDLYPPQLRLFAFPILFLLLCVSYLSFLLVFRVNLRTLFADRFLGTSGKVTPFEVRSLLPLCRLYPSFPLLDVFGVRLILPCMC